MLKMKAFALASGLAVLAFVTPAQSHAATINGTTTGSTATATGVYDGTLKETVTSKTIDIKFMTTGDLITTVSGQAAWSSYNFVYAGSAQAPGTTAIAADDFTISQYAPWVINNNSTTNFVTGPDGVKKDRDVTNLDAGGANIVISYKPQGTDPTDVNFLQVYTLSMNGGAYSTATADNGGTGGPFYNEKGVSGVGNANKTGTIPLVSSNTAAAWLLDIPFTPEGGYDLAHPVDETINSETDRFQTFITSKVTIGGTDYNVIYGGIEWGYTFTTVDVPEPATLVLVSQVGVVGLVGYRWRRRHRRAA